MQDFSALGRGRSLSCSHYMPDSVPPQIVLASMAPGSGDAWDHSTELPRSSGQDLGDPTLSLEFDYHAPQPLPFLTRAYYEFCLTLTSKHSLSPGRDSNTLT